MSESRRLQFTPDLEICRILNGMWQVSGSHGSIAPQKAIPSMFSYLDAGFTTWDLADHYGPAEDFIGEFRRQLVAQRGIDALNNLQAFTKWGKIKHLALTNFDTEHLKIILSAGIKIVSNQVQFSLIDRRPLVKMAQFCQEHNIYLLAYGTLAGGLLGAKYLGHPEPNAMSLNTASLRKYKNMINAWGNWQLFQELLTVLKAIADSYHVTIPNVAVRYVLEQKAVAGAIIGVRLGVAEHIQENARIFDFQLSPQDYQKIDHVLQKSRDLLQLIGDCGDEYRR